MKRFLLAMCLGGGALTSPLSAAMCTYPNYQTFTCSGDNCHDMVTVGICNGPYGNPNQCTVIQYVNCCASQLGNYGDGGPCQGGALGKSASCTAPTAASRPIEKNAVKPSDKGATEPKQQKDKATT